YADYKFDDNPMMFAIHKACSGNSSGDTDLILHELDLYPENQQGFGRDYWQAHGKTIAEKWGGGESQGYSREQLPMCHRHKDSFLWQRNARRLSGDDAIEYPGTDYLFVYWFCRYHKIIPATPPLPTVQQQ